MAGINSPAKRTYKTYGKKSPSQMAKEKNAIIAKIIKSKEVAISVSSARRDASMWVINHPNWQNQELTDKDRIDWIESVTKAFIRFYAKNIAEHSVLYQEIRDAESAILQKVETETEFDK